MHPFWTGIGGLSTAAAVVLMAPLLDPLAPGSCEKLVPSTRPGTTITSAQTIDAGRFAPPSARGNSTFGSLSAFCRVEATLRPAPDSEIKVEAWLPASGWNGRFQAVGNRGWGGTIAYAALGQAVAAGYASVSTDTGHTGNGASFALGHPDKLVDSGSRAVHEATVWAKKLVEAFYGRAPAFSYWNGCSLGGRQGFAEAQRFPADYDGIVAGDPANDLTRLYAARLAWAQAVHERPDSYISPAKYPVIHGAVLEACDGLDGVKDGVLEDPARCHFDPKVLECKGEDAPECLTTAQVETARALYRDVRHPRTGETLSTGLTPGSELGWAAVAGPQPENNAVDLFKYVVFQNPSWDWRTFNLAADVDRANHMVGGIINASDTNLEPFFKRGGKLLVYHGWADPQTAPGNSVAYLDRVATRVGSELAGASLRLFMVPGMGHCEGGDGTDTFDRMTPLVQWVEHATAPERIVAAHATGGKVVRTRPLCAYGQVARWTGAGSTDDEANFWCEAR